MASSKTERPKEEAPLARLLAEIRACRACEEELPLGPRPVLRAAATARVLVVGQAPGTAVHRTGVPWNDPSGDRLREWLDLDRETFYDAERFSIVPMGLCYPGKGRGGAPPPRKECAELWFERLFALLPNIETTLLIGQYAQAHFLGRRRKKTLTETVRAWRAYAPEFFPLVHPSPRNTFWLRKNPWFAEEVVPALRQRVHSLL